MDEISICFMKNDKTLFEIPTFVIPDGAQFRECYETEKEIVVIGYPKSDDETHNCDQMGCSTISHVLYRFIKS